VESGQRRVPDPPDIMTGRTFAVANAVISSIRCFWWAGARYGRPNTPDS
jgi:hypothetical protein